MINRFSIAAFLTIILSSCNSQSSDNNVLQATSSETSAECTIQNDSTPSSNSISEFTYSALKEAEMKLIEILKERYGDPNEYSECMLNDELIDFIIKEPLTLDYQFDSLQSRGFANVVTSEDGNLRFYYWNDGTGGTCISWRSICQYRSNGKIYTYRGDISQLKYGKQNEEYIESAPTSIITIYDNSGSPIYLVNTYIKESSQWGYESIEAIKIENDKLTPVPIFDVDGHRDMYTRGVEYTIADWYFRANNGEGWDWLFSYDNKNKILYIPEAEPELSDRYSLYRYDGEKMHYIGTDGGFWLHPSIRSFKFLELVLDTKDYRIRVDKMFDNSYRYVAWENKITMNDTPDIVLLNGTFDEKNSNYHFKNKGYEYIVNENTGIVVKYKDRVILSQERCNKTR